MADPRSWDLLAAFEACLSLITVANGYHTDAGTFVTREPQQINAADHDAVIGIVLEALGAATEPALVRTHRLATVMVVGKVGTGRTDAQVHLHKLIADIERALDRKQGQFAVGTQYPVFVEARPIPPAEGMKWIGVEVRFTTHVPKS